MSSAKVNPALLLQQRAEKQPEDLAIAFENQRFSWRQFNARANQFAAFFKANQIGPGDVVALMMDNRPDYIFCVMGLNRVGAIASLINTNLKGDALSSTPLKTCGAKTLSLGPSMKPHSMNPLRQVVRIKQHGCMHHKINPTRAAPSTK